MRIQKLFIFIVAGLTILSCAKPSRTGQISLLVTANVHGQLDPCG